MKIERNICGIWNNLEVTEFKLTNDNGMYVTILNPGGTVRELVVKDKKGDFRDVMLQYMDLDGIYENKGNLGVIVARNANRIANAKAKISGKVYELVDNNNGNNLHSGPDFFYKKMLNANTFEKDDEVGIEFSYQFKDMEQGYPGNMDFKLIYTLTNDNEFKIRYEALSDADTIFNPTWHGYFNLKGHMANDISSHKIKICADQITYVNDRAIPEGLMDVKGTPFDFVSDFKGICDEIDADNDQIKKGKGYDHNFALNSYDGNMRKVVEVKESDSGIEMDVYSDAPGIQFYTGNALSPEKLCKNGGLYVKRGGFCLETQYFPNAINDDRFISPLLKKDEKKALNTTYSFR